MSLPVVVPAAERRPVLAPPRRPAPHGLRLRPWREADLPQTALLVDEAFGLSDFVPMRRAVRPVLVLDVLDSLSRADHAVVAEAEGRIAGVLMGQLPGRPVLPGRGRRRALRAVWAARAAAATGRQVQMWREQRLVAGSHTQLRRRARTPLGLELTLFLVASRHRGRGIGGALFGDYLERLRRGGAGRFHLHTDDSCTWEYYEQRGMERVASDLITVRTTAGLRDVETYLYVGDA